MQEKNKTTINDTADNVTSITQQKQMEITDTGNNTEVETADPGQEPETAIKEDELEKLKAEMNLYKEEVEHFKDKYLRLFAEFENYKRRTSKERIEYLRTAGQDVIKDLLPALDDIDRAQEVINDAKDINAIKEGLNLIKEKFKNTLEQKGLKEIECKGLDFNVESMESIAEIEAPSKELKGKVVEVVQNGYTLNDKIIRYAKVVVGR